MGEDSKIVLELFKNWKYSESNPHFVEKLIAAIECRPNPFHAIVVICAHRNKPKQVDFVKDVLSGFSTWLSRRCSDDTLPPVPPPALDTKRNAFHVFVHNLRVRDGETLTLICLLFRLAESGEEFYWNVREILLVRQNYVLASVLIKNLNLYDRFDLEDIFVRLLLADQLQNLESFVESSPAIQRRLLTLLDKWISLTDEEIKADCYQISPDLEFVIEKDFTKVKRRRIAKLASRFLAAAEERFESLDDEGADSTTTIVCKNLFHEKLDAYLTFNSIELKSKRIDLPTFHDLVDPLVEAEADSHFPKYARLVVQRLKAFSNLSPYQNFSSSSSPSSYSTPPPIETETLAKLCLGWRLPLAEIVSISPLLGEEASNLLESGPSKKVARDPRLSPAADSIIDDVMLLPLPDSAVSFVSSPSDFRRFLSSLSRNYDDVTTSSKSDDVIAIDAEFNFSLPFSHLFRCQDFREGTSSSSFRGPGVALLQLATRDRVVLLDVNSLKKDVSVDWDLLGVIFADPRWRKLGFGLTNDLKVLSRTIPSLSTYLERRVNCVDLDVIVDNLETHDPRRRDPGERRLVDDELDDENKMDRGLGGAVRRLLGKFLDKSVQRSNWDRRPLRPKQRNYAALDAYVLIPLYDAISTKIRQTDVRIEDLMGKEFPHQEAEAAKVSKAETKEAKAPLKTVRKVEVIRKSGKFEDAEKAASYRKSVSVDERASSLVPKVDEAEGGLRGKNEINNFESSSENFEEADKIGHRKQWTSVWCDGSGRGRSWGEMQAPVGDMQTPVGDMSVGSRFPAVGQMQRCRERIGREFSYPTFGRGSKVKMTD